MDIDDDEDDEQMREAVRKVLEERDYLIEHYKTMWKIVMKEKLISYFFGGIWIAGDPDNDPDIQDTAIGGFPDIDPDILDTIYNYAQEGETVEIAVDRIAAILEADPVNVRDYMMFANGAAFASTSIKEMEISEEEI